MVQLHHYYYVDVGPILFLLYTVDLLGLIEDNINMQLHRHLYADVTQICGFCAPAEASDLQQRISTCVDHVSEWMLAKRLPKRNSRGADVTCCGRTKATLLAEMCRLPEFISKVRRCYTPCKRMYTRTASLKSIRAATLSQCS